MAEVPIDIAHVSKLARLALTPEEADSFVRQFGKLFDFIKELQELDVTGVHPTAQVIPLQNVMRDDAVKPCLTRDEALSNAPDTEGPYFKTPRILE